MTWKNILKISTEEAIQDAERYADSEDTEMEKVAGAVTTSSAAHRGLFRPTFGGKRRKRKKKED